MLPRNIPVNQISWLCTHNAYNSEDEIGAGSHEAGGTNQNHSIPVQLDSGVRALMLDIHGDKGAPRVRHEAPGAPGASMHYKDLCDVLVELKDWLVSHTSEVILLLLEVTKDVEPEWIRDTFAGAGPVHPQSGRNYDLSALLYVHTSAAWPTIDQLVTSGKRVIVFRETDDGKGRTITDNNGNVVPSLAFYMDMWKYWVETPYSNIPASGGNQFDKFYWENLQSNTYLLERGNPATASFFNLNSFVDARFTAVGSAGMANGMNRDAYLKARALIAWKVQARKPTLSVDFFKSIQGEQPSYNTLDTADHLNTLATLSGRILEANGVPSTMAVAWEGLTELRFSDYLGAKYLDWTIDENVVPTITPTSHGGTYCFPTNKDGSAMTLVPVCRGHDFAPTSVAWDGRSTVTQDFVVTPTQYATKDELARAGVLDTPLWIHPVMPESPVCYWEVAGDSPAEGAAMQLWARTEAKNEWRIRFADDFHGHHRFEIYNASLDRYASVMYPWRQHPAIAGYPVTSQQRSQYVNTQRFYVHQFDGKFVFVSSDVGSYALVPENGNLGKSTKLVLGGFDHTFPDQYCWKVQSATR